MGAEKGGPLHPPFQTPGPRSQTLFGVIILLFPHVWHVNKINKYNYKQILCLWCRGGGRRACAVPLPAPPMASVIPDTPASFQTNPMHHKACGNTANDRDDPGTSTCVRSISHDHVKKGFNLEWEDLDDFNSWCKAEQLDNSIEFISHHTICLAGPIWHECCVYSCACGWTKGKDPYQPKSGTNRKIEKKFMDCKCKITLKLYWHVPTVLGHYEAGGPFPEE
jgi:hypothetical protein